MLTCLGAAKKPGTWPGEELLAANGDEPRGPGHSFSCSLLPSICPAAPEAARRWGTAQRVGSLWVGLEPGAGAGPPGIPAGEAGQRFEAAGFYLCLF